MRCLGLGFGLDEMEMNYDEKKKNQNKLECGYLEGINHKGHNHREPDMRKKKVNIATPI